MNGRPTTAAAGKIDVGGDLTVNRLGFGAMRITGLVGLGHLSQRYPGHLHELRGRDVAEREVHELAHAVVDVLELTRGIDKGRIAPAGAGRKPCHRCSPVDERAASGCCAAHACRPGPAAHPQGF
jgi:hypothetical protein